MKVNHDGLSALVVFNEFHNFGPVSFFELLLSDVYLIEVGSLSVFHGFCLY